MDAGGKCPFESQFLDGRCKALNIFVSQPLLIGTVQQVLWRDELDALILGGRWYLLIAHHRGEDAPLLVLRPGVPNKADIKLIFFCHLFLLSLYQSGARWPLF